MMMRIETKRERKGKCGLVESVVEGGKEGRREGGREGEKEGGKEERLSIGKGGREGKKVKEGQLINKK